MKHLFAGSIAVVLVSACVGDGIEMGGRLKPVEVPAATVPCSRERLTRTHYVEPRYPDDAVMFYLLAAREGHDVIPIQYDVTPGGETANIRFVGSPRLLEHRTRQKLIRAAGEALAKWRFEWNGAPGYATGCAFTVTFATEGVGDGG